MSTLDGSILSIANPSIAKDFNVSMEAVKWVVTSYMLMITASLIFFGRLGDKIGSNKIYTGGFLVFTVGSLCCSLSPSLPLLIASRVFQGIGASMLMATGIGIISNTFPSGERGKALGLTGAVVGIGNMTGPSVGGLILAHFHWSAIFLINLPIGLLAFFLAMKYLQTQPTNPAIGGFDLPGTALFATTVVILIASLSGTNGINVLLMLLSILFLLVFLQVEKHSNHPMLDFSLFKVIPFVYGNVMAFAVYTIQTSVFFLMPFYMETLLKLTPSMTGLLMTIPPVTMALLAPLSGTLSDKIGSPKILSVSFFLLACAFLVFLGLGSKLNILLLSVGLFLLGLGMGMFGSPNNSSILGSIPREKAGYAGGFISTTRNLSFSLGIAASASIFTYVFQLAQKTLPYATAYVRGNHVVYVIAVCIAAAGFLFSLFNQHSLEKKAANAE